MVSVVVCFLLEEPCWRVSLAWLRVMFRLVIRKMGSLRWRTKQWRGMSHWSAFQRRFAGGKSSSSASARRTSRRSVSVVSRRSLFAARVARAVSRRARMGLRASWWISSRT